MTMSSELHVRVTKGKGKPDTLTCRRPDGSTTWARCPGPGLHDLIHYVVETELGLENSFYSLVARGHDISDFNVPGASKALNLPDEAGQTEFIVGLLQTELASGARFDDFVVEVRNACSVAGAPPPESITPSDVERIRTVMHQLLDDWANTTPGGFMGLIFPVSGSGPQTE